MPCRAALASHGEPDEVLACSSAGGGLRLAVVGYEREVTAEAGHRVGLCAGAKVVHVARGPMSGADVAALRAARPDLVLLVGGTDGGNADVLLHNAERIAQGAARAPRSSSPATPTRPTRSPRCWRRPGAGHVVTDNVLPTDRRRRARGGARAPSARPSSPTSSAARGSPAAAGSPSWCRPPPRMPCCAGWRCSPTSSGGDVLVVDVGGATTDVYSVITPQGEDADHPPRGRRHRSGTRAPSRPTSACGGPRRGWWRPASASGSPLSDNMIRYAAPSRPTPGTSRRRTRSGPPRRRSPRRLRWWRCAGTAARRTRRSGRARSPTSSLVVGSGGVLRHATWCDVGDRACWRG